MKGFRVLLAAAALLWGPGCGEAGDGSDGAVEGPQVVFRFGPATVVEGEAKTAAKQGERFLPFPYDYFLREDPSASTGHRIQLGERGENSALVDGGVFLLGSVYRDAVNDANGFSLIAPALIALTEPIDPATLPQSPEQSVAPEASVFLTQVADPTARHPVQIVFRSETLARGAGEAHFLWVRPWGALQPNTRYMMVVTDAVKNAEGRSVTAPRDFRYIVEPGLKVPEDHAGAADILAERARMVPALSALETMGMEMNRVSACFDFTTGDPTQALETISARLASGEISVGEADFDKDDDGELDRLLFEPDEFPNVAVAYKGAFDAPSFIDANIHFRHDLAQQGVERIPFLLGLPKNPAAQPVPVVVLLHGLSDRKENWFAGFVDQLCEAGFAAFAFDQIHHGERNRNDSPQSAATDFLNLNNPLGIRDSFRQQAVDIASVAALLDGMAELDIYGGGEALDAPDGQPDLKTGEYGFMGISLGSMIGAIGISLADQYRAAVLNVGGGTVIDFVSAQLEILAGLNGFTEIDMLSVLAQNILDSSDAATYGPFAIQAPLEHVSTPRHVLLQESIGDNVVPNFSTENLARAMGVPLVTPLVTEVPDLERVSAPHAGSGLFQFDPQAGQGNHTFLFSNSEAGRGARAQALSYLRSWTEGDVPVIADPAQLP